MSTSSFSRIPRSSWSSWAALAAIGLLGACTVHPASRPDEESVRGIRFLEAPDPTTIDRLGRVNATITLHDEDFIDAETHARMALAREALARFPGTQFLVDVHVSRGTHAATWEASGVAAALK